MHRFSLSLLTLFLVLRAAASHGQIQVTEVMYDPLNDNVWEWIEVRNTGNSAVNLDGYIGSRLGDPDLVTPRAAIDSTYTANTVVPAGGVAVIYDANYGSINNPLSDPNSFMDDDFRQAWQLGPSVPLIGAVALPPLSNTTGSLGQSFAFWPSAEAWRADMTPSGGGTDAETTSFDNAVFGLNYSLPQFPERVQKFSITWNGEGNYRDGQNWFTSALGDGTGATTSQPVEVEGTLNDITDLGNPGIVPGGTPDFASPLGLHITEVMYDPASTPDGRWEWVEIYNSSTEAIDLSGWVLEDNDNPAVSAANIHTGSIEPGGTAILYNSLQEHFAAAWGETLNLIPVAEWSDLALSNGGDKISLWTSFGSFSSSPTEHRLHENAEVTLSFVESDGYPTLSGGPSISLGGLDLDPKFGDNWVNASADDGVSFNPQGVSDDGNLISLHVGGDVGSPGTFRLPGETTPGDFDNDGDVDGYDFLLWQQGGSPDPLSPGDLSAWQANYGNSPGSLSANVVPEPHSLALLAATTLPLLAATRRIRSVPPRR